MSNLQLLCRSLIHALCILVVASCCVISISPAGYAKTAKDKPKSKLVKPKSSAVKPKASEDEPTAVNQNDLLITPGKGVGDINLGMDVSTLEDLIGGKPLRVTDEQEERESFARFHYVPENWLFFRMGFDKAIVFNDADKLKYPIFKVFVKNDKIIYIILSSQFGDPSVVTCTAKGVGLKSSFDKVIEEFGQPKSKLAMRNYDGQYGYENKGIIFVMSTDKKVYSIDIFAPVKK